MSSPLTFHLIPHTHWDREWYLTRAAFQARLVPVLDDVLDQLETDPGLRFLLDGQTVLLEDYLAVKPENEPRIAALVRRGALEIGPWYILSDLLIPSAESLRRNLAEGARDSERFGRRLDVLYSPDAFGHPAELPELAAEFGLRRAVIRRGLGRPNGVDRDLYHWKASDGAGLLVYHLPAGGYDTGIDLAGAGKDMPARWTALRRELVARAVSTQIAVFLGADHHAMPLGVGELRESLCRLEPGNEVRISGLSGFFDAVEQAGPDLPPLTGELRRIQGHTWVLQDTHSTRAAMKRRHSRVELALARIADPLARLAAASQGEDRSGLLRLAWRALLQSQFHDTLAGTTSDAVQKEQELRLDDVEALSREIARASLYRLAGHDPDRARTEPTDHRLILWNPSARARSAIVTAELTFFREDVQVGPPSERVARTGDGYRPVALQADAGGRIPVQLVARRLDRERIDAMRHYPDQDEVDRAWIAFRPPPLEGSAIASLAVRDAEGVAEDEGLEVAAGYLANRFVQVRISRTGAVTIVDRRSGQVYEGLSELEDEPDHGDLYTFSGQSGRAVRSGRGLSQRILAPGPLVGGIETRWGMQAAGPGGFPVRQVVALHADSPVVRIRLDVTKMGKDHRLRAWFPVGAGGVAVAGTAFGVARRPPVERAPGAAGIETPARTAPAHRFVSAGDGSRGLALLAPGFFEYEWTADHRLAVTLFRSTGELARSGLTERPGMAGWGQPTPLAQEIGLDTIELAVAPLESGEAHQPDELTRQWEDTFLPVQVISIRGTA